MLKNSEAMEIITTNKAPKIKKVASLFFLLTYKKYSFDILNIPPIINEIDNAMFKLKILNKPKTDKIIILLTIMPQYFFSCSHPLFYP